MGKIIHPKRIIKAVLLSQVITVILTGILAVAVTLWNFKESTVGVLVFAIMILSVLSGAFILAKNVESGGLVNGLVLALGYYAAIWVIATAIGKGITLDFDGITKIATILSSGMLGGVLGINA